MAGSGFECAGAAPGGSEGLGPRFGESAEFGWISIYRCNLK